MVRAKAGWDYWTTNIEKHPDREAVVHWVAGEPPFRWAWKNLFLAASSLSIRLVRSRGTRLVFCYIPSVDLLGRMDPARHTQVVELFRRYARDNEGVEFLNYQETFGSRYELFSDPVHLNLEGRRIFTTQLKTDLQHVLSQ